MRNCQFASAYNDMPIPFFTQGRVSGPLICVHPTSACNIALNEAAEILTRLIGHAVKMDSTDTSSCLALIPFFLNPYNNQRLALDSSSTLSGFLATDAWLINLDQTG